MHVRKAIRRNGNSPFISIPLAENMEMRRGNFFTVRVPMRRTAKIQADKRYYLSGTILVSSF